ncbi:MAG: putative Zn-dependent protease [Arcticibacterium sp.]|jgi:predicted Zn-dependent protease
MKKIRGLFIGLFAIAFIGMSCQRVPLTNRKQFVGMVSSDQMKQLSFAQYTGFMDTSSVVSNKTKEGAMVARVGSRIKKAVEDYLIANNYSEAIDGYQWEFSTVKSDQINAWCMPGGKVCFYTGILPICQTEDGIAVVMGHEIAHAIADHGRERMSRALIAQGLTQVGAVAAGVITKDQRVMETAGQVLGIGTQLGGVLPNSRKQETESDKLGLIFMAMAGYNPNEAVAFWKRMAAAAEGKEKPPQILSTHPTDAGRIAELEKLLPKAMKYYYAYGGK